MADDFMRVSLARDYVGVRPRRRGLARKTRDCHIEAAPEKMHRTTLADESRAKLLENGVHFYERAPEAVRILSVVRRMIVVVFEANRIGYFNRHGPDLYFDSQVTEC